MSTIMWSCKEIKNILKFGSIFKETMLKPPNNTDGNTFYT